MQAEILEAAVALTYAAGSSTDLALKKFNGFRDDQSLSPLNQNANADIPSLFADWFSVAVRFGRIDR